MLATTGASPGRTCSCILRGSATTTSATGRTGRAWDLEFARAGTAAKSAADGEDDEHDRRPGRRPRAGRHLALAVRASSPS